MAGEYEGLNLPQLLDRMHDIVVPAPVSLAPQTVAWWVLLAWAVAVGLLAGGRLLRRWQANAYRREALRLLEAIADDASMLPAARAGQIATLLKRTAVTAFPRHQVASLYGEAWAEFLVSSCGGDAVVAANAARFARAAYDLDTRDDELLATARQWIQVHRA